MQENLDAIAATGTQVVGVSYDAVETLLEFAESSGVKFPLLADPGSTTIRGFGIHSQQGLPQPCTYVIGADRKVVAAISLEGYRQRHSAHDLIKAINEIAP